MVLNIEKYFDFDKMYNDLYDAIKLAGFEGLVDYDIELDEKLMGIVKDFFRNKNNVNHSQCTIINDMVTLEKCEYRINANESDAQGSFYSIWITYSFDEDFIVDAGYEQG